MRLHHDVVDIVLCQLIHRSPPSAGLTTARSAITESRGGGNCRATTAPPPLLSPSSRTVTTRLALTPPVCNYFCLPSPDIYRPCSFPDNFQTARRYLSRRYLATLDPRPIGRITSRICHYSPSAAASVLAADTRANLARTLDRTRGRTSRLIVPTLLNYHR